LRANSKKEGQTFFLSHRGKKYMAGEIHGVIDRDQTWRMWERYGERGAADGSWDPTNLSLMEVRRIILGASGKTHSELWRRYEWQDGRLWWDVVAEELCRNPNPDVLQILADSNQEQLAYAAALREQALNEGPTYLRYMGGAALKLTHEGIFTPSQLDAIQSWLMGPDDLPRVQYTPMSHLEFARHFIRYEGEEPDISLVDCTNPALGIIESVYRLTARESHKTHNKVHEFVHAALHGLEAWDITRVDGWRHPQITVDGVSAYTPTTALGGGDFSDRENSEINEGWTGFITRELMRVEPNLGKVWEGDKGGYSEWSKTVGTLKKEHPDLFRAITDAIMVEASPANPTVKREALVSMHQYADRMLGKGALSHLFLEKGGSLVDIYTRSKNKG
jgi:hypothetical protein